MKIVLIYPDISTIQFPHFQHGVASVSAVLKRGGHDVSLIYLNQEIPDEELVERVRIFNPGVVAFSSTTMQWPFVKRYGKAVKDRLGLPIVLGGIHATITPETAMAESVFDVLVQAEGEYPMLDYVNAIEKDGDYGNIRNLWVRMPGGGIKANPLRPPADLEGLPFVDRDLFDNDVLMRDNDRQVALMASRGCPYGCTYCCNSVLTRLAGGAKNWVRMRRVESVLEEIRLLHRKFPDMKSMIFMDEIFTLKKSWITDFCEQYKARFSTPFQIFLRVETVDYEMLKMMREAGLYSIIVGVESGNDRIRREVLNRHMTNEQIERVFRWADDLGLETWDFNMIGLPGETEENVRETIELNRRIRPNHVQISIFYPFPGTPLHDRCIKENLTPREHTTSVFHNRPTLELPNLSRDKIYQLFDEFRALGYLLEAQKKPAGYYDFTAHFEQARIKSGGEKFVALWLIRIRGEDRTCLLLHPPSSATYNLAIRPRSVLRFGMAFSPDVWDKPGKGCTFEVLIKTRFRGRKIVFSEYIDPKHNPDHRGWLDREISMVEFAGKKIELTFQTSTAPGENEYCVAFWSRPHLAGQEDR